MMTWGNFLMVSNLTRASLDKCYSNNSPIIHLACQKFTGDLSALLYVFSLYYPCQFNSMLNPT